MQTDDDSSKFVKNLEYLKFSFHFSIEFGMKNVDLWLKVWYQIYIHKVHVKKHISPPSHLPKELVDIF
jgi:hypothetical protein